MNKELIQSLIKNAREASENAYCPNSNVAEGACLLTNDNMVFNGCNIENSSLACSMSATEAAVANAVVNGKTNFSVLCLYSEKEWPVPDGRSVQILSEFNHSANVIIANADGSMIYKLHDMLPFRRIVSGDE